jgi:hydrogenase large subunit
VTKQPIPTKGPVSFEWKIPRWSNTIERDRARTYFQAYAAACALHFIDKALEEVRAGHTRTWETSPCRRTASAAA